MVMSIYLLLVFICVLFHDVIGVMKDVMEIVELVFSAAYLRFVEDASNRDGKASLDPDDTFGPNRALANTVSAAEIGHASALHSTSS